MTFFSSLFGAKTQDTDTVKILNAEAFNDAISKENVQLIDVRTPAEYNGGFIKNAKNIDYFQQGTFKSNIEKLNKNKPIYLYCRSGNRSQKAAHSLSEMGFTQIFDLSGGYMKWPYKSK
tara:strand:- start:1343 stop:1699 length:357 start_codon:yes stop_codon:yes gene_type:complete